MTTKKKNKNGNGNAVSLQVGHFLESHQNLLKNAVQLVATVPKCTVFYVQMVVPVYDVKKQDQSLPSINKENRFVHVTFVCVNVK